MDESKLPDSIVKSIPADLLAEAKEWWANLPAGDRQELESLCDQRKEIFLFETFADCEDKPKIKGGKFIPHDDAFGISEWGEDYFQHLLDHPELIIVWEPEQRTFHVGCSRHIEARSCFVKGFVDEDFTCPFDLADCRIQRILDGQTAIGLRPLPASAKITNHALH